MTNKTNIQISSLIIGVFVLIGAAWVSIHHPVSPTTISEPVPSTPNSSIFGEAKREVQKDNPDAKVIAINFDKKLNLSTVAHKPRSTDRIIAICGGPGNIVFGTVSQQYNVNNLQFDVKCTDNGTMKVKSVANR